MPADPVAGSGRLARFGEIIRYYQAGLVNLGFGYGLYAALVALGLGIYAAQAVSHVLGMAFNYVTYSRHVFRDAAPARLRFIASYAVNYALSLAVLAGLAYVIASPYLAGLATAVLVSIINYGVLKLLVFRRPPA
jgi:putative flippase GtrA